MSCFIFWFYIKPQLCLIVEAPFHCCFIFWFYIKPQPIVLAFPAGTVASYFDSTSNHNYKFDIVGGRTVASYFDSTSNHNCTEMASLLVIVASYFDSTSNHNCFVINFTITLLLHILILHQTTTKQDLFSIW